ncbi:MAG: hypothetical protein KAJ42_14550 [Gemmatimonadetes bacterium]|nr:hypothetical protein [Gemmatimonadota bacterium]
MLTKSRTIKLFVLSRPPADDDEHVYTHLEGIGYVRHPKAAADMVALETFSSTGKLPTGVAFEYTYNTDPQ